MLSVACATAVEALEADIEAVGVVLSRMRQDQLIDEMKWFAKKMFLTIESKHWVQSSR